jgi:hypothetical protein
VFGKNRRNRALEARILNPSRGFHRCHQEEEREDPEEASQLNRALRRDLMARIEHRGKAAVERICDCLVGLILD